MQPMPLVGSEVEQLRAALSMASVELAAAVRAMRDHKLRSIGTPSCDSTVVEAVTGLRSAVSGLGATADDCVRVVNRHPELAATTPAPAEPGAAAQETSTAGGPS